MLSIEEIQELEGRDLAQAVAAYCVWGDYSSTPEYDATVEALLDGPSAIMGIIEETVGRWSEDAKGAAEGMPAIAKIDWKAVRLEGDEEIETLASTELEGWHRAALLLDHLHTEWMAELD
jgi:hypothetical protein